MGNQSVDVVLIGAGIMSATLGVFLKTLQPDWTIRIYERLDEIGAESSAAWNNAGTGHAAYCELNYTPQKADGTLDCSKAFKINEQFELSKQFWAYLVAKGIIKDISFIHPVPHMSFVIGEKDVTYLKKRYDALSINLLFSGMEYSEDHAVLSKWFPLMMQNRPANQKVAATKMDLGTDVNFGLLTNELIQFLSEQSNTSLHLSHEVQDLTRANDGKTWNLKIKNHNNGSTTYLNSKFVFIGAGGGSLPLLSKTNIPESKGYGGFPVSGQWLKCTNEQIIQQHDAKVYGKAAVGAPPMSVPHLDSRVINGKKELLFGPYAGFSTKFLKEGSFWDLPGSIKMSNIVPLLQAGLSNMSLTKYLIQQVMLKPIERLEALKEYYPDAKIEDWELAIAGQRVQVIKKGKDGKGKLEFGTELVHAADGSVAALLGASPGASTTVAVMLDLFEHCFPESLKTEHWQNTIRSMIPSYNIDLSKDEALLKSVRNYAAEKLNIKA